MDTVTYTAPAYWASYIVNGDSSGLDPSEHEAADAFLATLPPDAVIAECEEVGFAWSNDATDEGGNCCTYTFLL